MNKIQIVLAALAALALPTLASAHQHAEYEIGGKTYSFIVGSLNEPVSVDDKTGVELRVSSEGTHMAMEGTDDHSGGTAVTGLENSLKVELIAGSKKKVLNLSPVYDMPGSYSAKYYPTVATTLQYRFFGEVNNTPVDLTFTCREEGAEAADEGEKQISDGVKQISKTGGFGCPTDREDLGFPEDSSPIFDVSGRAGRANTMSMTAIALGAAALAVGFMRRRV